ncbi:hypothetical protein CEXT_652321, partial [Caerostris extrusa]
DISNRRLLATWLQATTKYLLSRPTGRGGSSILPSIPATTLGTSPLQINATPQQQSENRLPSKYACRKEI